MWRPRLNDSTLSFQELTNGPSLHSLVTPPPPTSFKRSLDSLKRRCRSSSSFAHIVRSSYINDASRHLQEPLQDGLNDSPTTLRRRAPPNRRQVRLSLPLPRPPPTLTNLSLTKHSKLPISEEDVLYFFEEIHRARSCAPPHEVPSRPCLLRWKKEKGLAWDNVVVFGREEGAK